VKKRVKKEELERGRPSPRRKQEKFRKMGAESTQHPRNGKRSLLGKGGW